MEQFLEIWTLAQTMLREQIRWKRFLKIDPEIRKQDVLQHTYAFSLFMTMVLQRIEEKTKLGLDALLLLTACLIHDWGEGELKNETEWVFKTESHDVAEYRSFCKRFRTLESSQFMSFRRAFLLQFVYSQSVSAFPLEAQMIMADLRENRSHEAKLFRIMEPLDYFMFGLEHAALANLRVLRELVDSHLAFLDEEVRNFTPAVLLWTPELREKCLKLVEGVPSLDQD